MQCINGIIITCIYCLYYRYYRYTEMVIIRSKTTIWDRSLLTIVITTTRGHLKTKFQKSDIHLGTRLKSIHRLCFLEPLAIFSLSLIKYSFSQYIAAWQLRRAYRLSSFSIDSRQCVIQGDYLMKHSVIMTYASVCNSKRNTSFYEHYVSCKVSKAFSYLLKLV